MGCPGTVGLTFVVCMIAGFTPLVNAEIFLLALAAGIAPACGPAIVVAAAAGQMTAKLCWYGAGSGLVTLGPGRMRARVEHARAVAAAHPRLATPVVLVSAVTGIPPFFVVSVATGAVHFGPGRFLALGLAGRIVRFSVVLSVPQLARTLLGWTA
jgi:membrane protein YqaA with SNARE-associated domain